MLLIIRLLSCQSIHCFSILINFQKKGFEKFFNEFFKENFMIEQSVGCELLRCLEADFNLFMYEKYGISETVKKEMCEYTKNLLNMQ